MAGERQTITIPLPLVAPLGVPVNCAALQDVWDTFVKPDQAAGNPQSAEMRILMAVLRAVYEGLMLPDEPTS